MKGREDTTESTWCPMDTFVKSSDSPSRGGICGGGLLSITSIRAQISSFAQAQTKVYTSDVFSTSSQYFLQKANALRYLFSYFYTTDCPLRLKLIKEKTLVLPSCGFVLLGENKVNSLSLLNNGY